MVSGGYTTSRPSFPTNRNLPAQSVCNAQIMRILSDVKIAQNTINVEDLPMVGDTQLPLEEPSGQNIYR